MALALSLLFLLSAGCNRTDAPSSQKQTVIGVSLLNLSSEFIVMVNQAMEAKAEELGVKLIVNDAQRSAERQVQQVESFIAQKVDAIILNPCEVEAVCGTLQLRQATRLDIAAVAASGRELDGKRTLASCGVLLNCSIAI